MSYRIAIASSDGEAVNQHFGQATNLLIYEVGDESVNFIEEREIKLISGEAAHTEGNMAIFADVLHDCSAIFVLRIGQRSLRYLLERNITAFEVNFPLNHIFNTLLKNKRRGRVRVLQGEINTMKSKAYDIPNHT
jgi:predicted Fe-Mo cluster-binding NifX family protein